MRPRLDIPVLLAGLLVAASYSGATESGAGGGGKSCRCIGLNPTCSSLKASRSQLVPKWCQPRLKRRAGEGRVEMEVRVLEAKGIDTAILQKTIEKNDSTLRRCYLEGHRVRRFPKGRLSVRMVSTKDGCTDTAVPIESRLPDVRTRKCLLTTLRAFTMAECYTGDPIRAKVEFRFQVVPVKTNPPPNSPAGD